MCPTYFQAVKNKGEQLINGQNMLIKGSQMEEFCRHSHRAITNSPRHHVSNLEWTADADVSGQTEMSLRSKKTRLQKGREREHRGE